jgi:protein gp37
MHPAWVRDLRDRCEATETAYLFKQWGNWIPQAHRMDPWWGQNPDAWVNEVTGETVLEGDPKLDKGSWAGVWRADKKLTGRGLDGRTWDGYPAGAP